MIIMRKYMMALFLLLLFTSNSQSRSTSSDLNLNQNGDLQISIEIQFKVVKTGNTFNFKTIVSNTGTGNTQKLIVAMNIINLQDGSPVDPEDWSPQRKQFVSPINSGDSTQQRWTVHAIIKGDYLVYMVVIPIPKEQADTSMPVSSSAIHLTVSAFTRLNPGGILPIAIMIPTILIIMFFVFRWKRMSLIDS